MGSYRASGPLKSSPELLRLKLKLLLNLQHLGQYMTGLNEGYFQLNKTNIELLSQEWTLEPQNKPKTDIPISLEFKLKPWLEPTFRLEKQGIFLQILTFKTGLSATKLGSKSLCLTSPLSQTGWPSQCFKFKLQVRDKKTT